MTASAAARQLLQVVWQVRVASMIASAAVAQAVAATEKQTACSGLAAMANHSAVEFAIFEFARQRLAILAGPQDDD